MAETTPLLTNINGVGSQTGKLFSYQLAFTQQNAFTASAADLSSLNLYSDLALLPKNADGPEEGDGMGDQASDKRAETPDSDGKVQHAKAMGRLKTKQALLKRQSDKGSSNSASGDERESKKIKLDQSA